MKKGWIIAIIIIALFAIGIIAGIYVYQKNNTKDSNITENKQLANNIKQTNQINNKTNNVISTSNIEEKISPNCIIIQKQYYKGCDHLIKNTIEIPEQYINQTQEQFENNYSNWNIEKFSKNEIIISQEKEGYCKEHYLIKEHNGVLGVYTIDENGIVTFKEDTEIQTIYLPETDLEKVKKGIEAIGQAQLHSVLEDFE